MANDLFQVAACSLAPTAARLFFSSCAVIFSKLAVRERRFFNGRLLRFKSCWRREAAVFSMTAKLVPLVKLVMTCRV